MKNRRPNKSAAGEWFAFLVCGTLLLTGDHQATTGNFLLAVIAIAAGVSISIKQAMNDAR